MDPKNRKCVVIGVFCAVAGYALCVFLNHISSSSDLVNSSDLDEIHKQRVGVLRSEQRQISPDSASLGLVTPPDSKSTGQRGAVPMPMTTADGALTSAARKMLGLSNHDAVLVHEIIMRRSREFEVELAKNAIYIDHESNENAGISVYRIPALPDERVEFYNAIQSDLTSKMGDSLAKDICSLFYQDPTNEEKLGGYGKYDLKIKFHPNEAGDARIASMTYTDPETGKQVRSGTMTIETFRERFGDTFEFDVE